MYGLCTAQTPSQELAQLEARIPAVARLNEGFMAIHDIQLGPLTPLPLLRLCALLCLVRLEQAVSASEVLSASCHLGEQPGIWKDGTWHILSTVCHLATLNPHRGGGFAPAEIGDLKVLFYGDSVARLMMHEFCETEDADKENSHNIDSFYACTRNNISVAQQSMIGVDPTGPYAFGRSGPPAPRVQHVSPDLAACFMKITGWWQVILPEKHILTPAVDKVKADLYSWLPAWLCVCNLLKFCMCCRSGYCCFQSSCRS